MSLIHDALKSIDTPVASMPVVRARVPGVTQAAASGWRSGLLAFALVIVAGALAWLGWRWWANATALPPPPPPAPALPMAVSAAVPAPLTIGAAEPVVVPQVPVAPPEPVVAATQKKKVPSAQTVKRVSAIEKENAEVPPAADVAPEARLVRFMEAMAEHRLEQAGQELAALRADWPIGTLALVRAQAWYDLQTGRDAEAVHGYRALLERLPGDEEAAINLASLLWRTRGMEDARAVLADAARVNPESAELSAALARFTPGARR